MNKQQPSLQSAIVTGLNILNDAEVRVPASQAEGVTALRMLLTALASGQLVVSEPLTAPPALPNGEVASQATTKVRKPRQSRQPKVNGATVPPAAAEPAAPTTVQ